MADAKIVDIKGVQWNLKDEVARNGITELEKNAIAQDLADVEINMNPGYTAVEHRFVQHYKVGKIHFLEVRIANLSGDFIGTSTTAYIGSVNLIPKKETSFMLFDYINAKVLRCQIGTDGSIGVGESNGVDPKNNVCFGEIIFAEA